MISYYNYVYKVGMVNFYILTQILETSFTRLIRLFTYLQIIIHIYACAYYKISVWETNHLHIHNEWVYNMKESKIH